MKRTSIEVDEVLIEELKKATGLKTTKEVVNYSLENTCRLLKQRNFLKFFGSASSCKCLASISGTTRLIEKLLANKNVQYTDKIGPAKLS